MSHEMPRTAPAAVADAESPDTDPIATLISTLNSARQPAARVACISDPDQPGRTTYWLTGTSRSAVQAAINQLMGKADDLAGHVEAHFLPPYLIGGGKWGSAGEVIVHASS